ncbi:hypothetical protein D9758_019085 [Tetrapyrgos nigripes]|uniref:Uncharacterized protein n=1 Tax=Tetrapyrgos nigripes TaxID=182062 RepID=A0A8H5B7W0_9AGAR|nr:hypothetical protein D9758_019085 [Tetrapyrgos nigripes]
MSSSSFKLDNFAQPSPPRSIFFLGATGYLGGQVLKFLGDKYSKTPASMSIYALIRSPVPERLRQLQTLYPNVTAIEGSLDDYDVIKNEASKHLVVINTASSDHPRSVEATLEGLKTYSLSHPGDPPLYIHTSGLGFTSDNARGQPVDEKDFKVYTDVGLDLEACEGYHLDCDKQIIRAGKDEDVPIRTVIVFPTWIYGLSDGPQKLTWPIRNLFPLFKEAGYAGTWGPGANRMMSCHVKDVADAFLVILQAALATGQETKLELKFGKEGLYFWGKILHKKGALNFSESKPLPDSVTAKFGEFGWSMLGGSIVAEIKRIKQLGWKAEVSESEGMSLLECLEEEVSLFLETEGYDTI